MNLRDENEKRRKHKIDDCRRVHDYDEFITTFVSMLAEQNLLGDLLEHGLNVKRSNRLEGFFLVDLASNFGVDHFFYLPFYQSQKIFILLGLP